MINQNSILHSINEALLPGVSMIDGRTEQDWLRFLSDFAALINFYEQDNTVHGNWEPFLLKDPVFLMAAISRTDFAQRYALYLQSCHKLDQLLNLLIPVKDIAISFNQLFDQLTRIFVQIRQWASYMQRSAIGYPLKTYVIREIKTSFANYLQAIFSLQKELSGSAVLTGFVPADPSVVASFEGYEERIWNEGHFQTPYWVVLGLSYPFTDNTLATIFKALTKVAELLFNFLKTIIQQSGPAFIRLSKLKSSYPDTTLLRTFINLLKVQQDQLNEIAGRHLNFYYKQIIKQTERSAEADHAFVIAALFKKDVTLQLPAGTLFDAGTDAQKNALTFESTAAVILNPAAIPLAYTLARAPGPDGLSSLQLQTVINPGIVQTNTDGAVLSWETLGSRAAAPATQSPLGIAFASPMLLLREGTRKITISLAYTGEPDLEMLQHASCYLSTLSAWYTVTADIQLVPSATVNTIVIKITLKHTDPPIERFLVNPDRIDVSWPMFKLVFDQITFPSVTPPVLHSMQIDVEVTNLETFQLYNDFGALSTKVAYPPFGPSPVKGSNFIIGSNEIFSKPISSLTIGLHWSVLPPDFSIYYHSYNLYLNNLLRFSRTEDIPWWEKIFGKKPPAQAPLPDETSPYNNACFTIDFQVLEAQSWTDVVFTTASPATTNLLFLQDGPLISPQSNYSTIAIPPEACDPSLQNQPMKFTELSTAGFLKMELMGPDYGFGSGVYPNVVAAVTLYNSQVLYGDGAVVFVDPAQLPFAPRLKSFSADYKASVNYILDKGGPIKQDQTVLKDYPAQVFLYSPFGNYLIYDNLNQPPVQEYNIGGSGAEEEDPLGIPLYAAYNFDGFLYLQIDNLIAASSFNLYFELARQFISGNLSGTKVNYYYLANTGWKPLTVLSDGTHNLTCSGIVSVNVPEDITMDSSLMPVKSYWIAAAANDISAVANTVLLSTNGIEVQRSGKSTADAFSIPALAGNVITKTKNAIPQISTVQQPFPSFGGKVAEDEKAMNQRVSKRIKTKDRAVMSSDFFNLIDQQFSEIYDVNSVYNSSTHTTTVYVVKGVESRTAPNAFLPMVSTSLEEQIKLYLQQRSSAFSVVNVANPDYQSVKVYATISIHPECEFKAVQQRIVQSLNIYLSPWIKDDGAQVVIYQEISDAQVSAFIQTISGVAAVHTVFFKTWMYSTAVLDAEENAIRQSTVMPLNKPVLLISNLVHKISLNPASL